MIAIIGFTIFAGAFGASVAVIYQMLAPQWQRIVSLATGHMDSRSEPLATLVLAERRIAARNWAMQSASFPVSRRREAA